MKTFTTLSNLFNTLSQNTTTANTALGKQLINDSHRYLIQKYFDNERTFQLITVGPSSSLTLTGSVLPGATTATLSASWFSPTSSRYVTQQVVFSSGEMRNVTFQQNSTAISWQLPLYSGATTAISTKGVQDYDIPAHVSKIKDDTITVGQLKYKPVFVQSIQDWNRINALPYNSDIPNYCFIYNGKLSFFPIPATTGNVITFAHKTRVPDMTFTDYTTGNVTAMTVNSTQITGTSTSWNTTGRYPLSTDLTLYNLCLRADPPNGDGIWYPIYKFTSDTVLNLQTPVINAPNIISSTSYTIGQLPLLIEDFHDIIVYRSLRVYFATFVKDKDKYDMYDAFYKDGLELLKDYGGTKSVNVDLEDEPSLVNPNLFIYST